MPMNPCAASEMEVNREEAAARRTMRVICHQRTSSQSNNAELTTADMTSSQAAFVITGLGGTMAASTVWGISGSDPLS
ncbi:MAG: hypothetical protein WCS42_10130 [Verrucomicrobiota bacterium]